MLSNLIVSATPVLKSNTGIQAYKALRNADAAAGHIRVRFRVTQKDFTFFNVPSGGIVNADVDMVFDLNTTVTRVEGLTVE
jgi:hypothetical protein